MLSDNNYRYLVLGRNQIVALFSVLKDSLQEFNTPEELINRLNSGPVMMSGVELHLQKQLPLVGGAK